MVDTAAGAPERAGGSSRRASRPGGSERAPAGSSRGAAAGAAGSRGPGPDPMLDDPLSQDDAEGVGPPPTEEAKAVPATPVAAPESAAGALGVDGPAGRASRPGARRRPSS